MLQDLVQFFISIIAPRQRPSYRYVVHQTETAYNHHLFAASDHADLERRMRDLLALHIGMQGG
jgi:hypothetical protein